MIALRKVQNIMYSVKDFLRIFLCNKKYALSNALIEVILLHHRVTRTVTKVVSVVISAVQ